MDDSYKIGEVISKIKIINAKPIYNNKVKKNFCRPFEIKNKNLFFFIFLQTNFTSTNIISSFSFQISSIYTIYQISSITLKIINKIHLNELIYEIKDSYKPQHVIFNQEKKFCLYNIKTNQIETIIQKNIPYGKFKTLSSCFINILSIPIYIYQYNEESEFKVKEIKCSNYDDLFTEYKCVCKKIDVIELKENLLLFQFSFELFKNLFLIYDMKSDHVNKIYNDNLGGKLIYFNNNLIVSCLKDKNYLSVIENYSNISIKKEIMGFIFVEKNILYVINNNGDIFSYKDINNPKKIDQMDLPTVQIKFFYLGNFLICYGYNSYYYFYRVQLNEN